MQEVVTQVSLSAIEQFFQHSSDAVLLGSLQNDYDKPAFQPEYLNPTARILLDLPSDKDALTALANSPKWSVLGAAIDNAMLDTAPSAVTFSLTVPNGVAQKLLLDITLFDPWLVVRLREDKAEVHLPTDGRLTLIKDLSATKPVYEACAGKRPVAGPDTKQLEERQLKLLEELKRSNQNLQQFAYIASHDLQEPLRKIQSFGDVLINQFSDNLGDSGSDMIRRMQSAAARMSVLIRDLLAYSRLSTQHEPYQPVALDSLVNDVLNDLELTLKESQTQVKLNPLPVLMANKTQLRQLMQNLIANAVKFRKPNAPSRIALSHRLVSGSALPLCLNQKQTYYEISVADEGIGFDPAYSDKIFQVFQRLHGRSEYDGTGMGLAICRKVAENHGGTVTATGETGAGSIFTVYLPTEPVQS